MQINVLFLGPARDLAGCESTTLTAGNGITVDLLRERIGERFPRIASALATMRVAVNQSFVPEHHVVESGDEVALIPPVSGG